MAAEGARPISSSRTNPSSASGGHRAISTGPPRMTPLREMQLVEQHRAGDPDAMGELLQAYQRRVYAICYRMLRNPDEAADLTQDSLIKVLEGLGSYDGRSKLSTWVIRVTMNCVLSHLRKQKLRKHASLEGLSAAGYGPLAGEAESREPIAESRPGELSPEQRIEQDDLRAKLRKAMTTLDPDAQAVLILRDMQGLDYDQLAEALDVPLGTVKSRLFRARAALRSAMESKT